MDTSGSMGDEAANVAKNLNSFGQHLSDEGIDFHLIVVEKDMSSVRLCVEPPLADKTCTSKVAGKKFFIHLIFILLSSYFHYDSPTGSTTTCDHFICN